MSNVIVVVYDDENEAFEVRDALKSVEKEGYLSLNDTAVVTKDPDGKSHVKNAMDKDVGIGIVGGSLVGLLIAGLLFPIAGLVIGAVGGGLIGKMVSDGIDKKFVKEVTEAMKPGTSSLFVVVQGEDPGPIIAVLGKYKGTIYHSSLDEDIETELRRAMEGK
jgi:uncharacterized membrane protein